MSKKKAPKSSPRLTDTQVKSTADVRMKHIGEAHKTIRWLAVVGCIVGCAYYFSRSVEFASGKETNFRATLQGLTELNANTYLAGIVASLCGGTVWYKRSALKKAELAAGRNAALEASVDPNRKGSGLREDGTNPEGDPQ